MRLTLELCSLEKVDKHVQDMGLESGLDGLIARRMGTTTALISKVNFLLVGKPSPGYAPRAFEKVRSTGSAPIPQIE
jgi:hypothetical protein